MVRYAREAEVRRFIVDAFLCVGMSAAHADLIAQALVWADLRGVDSHGVLRLPQYIQWAKTGVINVHPDIRREMLSPSLLRLQADRAAGPIAMTEALAHLLPMAREGGGVALASIGRMTHSGALGYYSGKAADQGFACIAINSSIPLIPYHGSRSPALGTNPISIAVPGDRDALIFDMASSAIALGRLVQARKTGETLPQGWALDEDGAPTTDSSKAAMVPPLGGPKGSGLALMIECLTGLLAGHPILADALEGKGEGRKHRQNAVLIVIDVARFLPLEDFRNQIGRITDTLKALPLASGTDEILVPGERGYRSMKKRRTDGIPLTNTAITDLDNLAESLSMPKLEVVAA